MADLSLHLRWTGEGLEFRGGAAGGPELVLDGDGRSSASPVQALLLALAGCMAADVVLILEKGRTGLQRLSVEVEADRRPEPPRRLTRVVLRFTAGGLAAGAEEKLERAIALSAETYCSVLHTVREDVEVVTEAVLA
jgi:putative redox protein